MQAPGLHAEAPATDGGGLMRSQLFVPGDSEKKLAKGLDAGADCLFVDIEDSVAAANKDLARKDDAGVPGERAQGGQASPALRARQCARHRPHRRRPRRRHARPARRHSPAEVAGRRGCAASRRQARGARGGKRHSPTARRASPAWRRKPRAPSSASPPTAARAGASSR
ncbi:MAG: aldolase/citrate lyase family protein [Rhodoblastus sp.]